MDGLILLQVLGRVVIEVVYGFESDVYGGVDDRNAILACGAEVLEAVVVVRSVAASGY
jgi:hypothetical protein